VVEPHPWIRFKGFGALKRRNRCRKRRALPSRSTLTLVLRDARFIGRLKPAGGKLILILGWRAARLPLATIFHAFGLTIPCPLAEASGKLAARTQFNDL